MAYRLSRRQAEELGIGKVCPPGATSHSFGMTAFCVYDLGNQTCNDLGGEWKCSPFPEGRPAPRPMGRVTAGRPTRARKRGRRGMGRRGPTLAKASSRFTRKGRGAQEQRKNNCITSGVNQCNAIPDPLDRTRCIADVLKGCIFR